MYWNGLRPGDVHLNVAAPGWAKHTWSSYFVPFSAGVTVVAPGVADAPADLLLRVLVEHRITSLCASPNVWRRLCVADLPGFSVCLREAVSAGEPLDAGTLDRVWSAWGVRIRDGYGQTETTAQARR